MNDNRTAAPLPSQGLSCIAQRATLGSLSCFHGECRPSGECVCEKGWTYDTILMLQTNQCMPSWWLDTMFGVNLILAAAVGGMLAVNRWKLKDKGRRSVSWAIATQTCAAIVCITYLANREASVAVWLFLWFGVLGVLGSVKETMQIVFNVSAKNRHFQDALEASKLYVAFTAMYVLCSAPMIFIVIARAVVPEKDLELYNQCVAVMFLLLPVHEYTAVAYFAYVPTRLLRMSKSAQRAVTDESQQRHIAAFTRRLVVFRLVLFGMIPAITISCSGVFIVYMALGQMPFTWVLGSEFQREGGRGGGGGRD